MPITIAVCKELAENETRVALTPDIASKFSQAGANIRLQSGAGAAAGCPDALYTDVEFSQERDALLASADALLCVSQPQVEDLARLKPGATVLGFLAPHGDAAAIECMRERNITSFAVELIPRISRAQSMDALSSQAAVAGYKAALIAANTAGQFFPMLTTAAGTMRPATVLVVGAGVAGLQAIATAKRLGARVFGYDVRPETREQIESLGARFVELSISAVGEGGYARALSEDERARQQQELAAHVADMDVLITTAAVPGRPAPRIISEDMVAGMHAGAIIVDLAAESGGNCALTEAGKNVHHGGVTIVGPVNLASQLAVHASAMYSRNLWNFLSPWISEGEMKFDWEDEIIRGSALTHDGKICHQATRERIEGASK